LYCVINCWWFETKQVLGLPSEARPEFTIQLSSPIESLTVNEFYDPLDPDKVGSFADFRDVDTSVATITITAHDADIPLGTSALFDVKPLCEVEVMGSGGTLKKVSELEVAIIPDITLTKQPSNGGESFSEMFVDAITEEDNQGGNEPSAAESDAAPIDAKAKEDGNANLQPANGETLGQTEQASLQLPVCTVTFRIEYTPSINDQRQELYELKSQASNKRIIAIEKLRKSAATFSRLKVSSSGSDTKDQEDNGPTVKSGFLNKKKKKEPLFLVRWYQKTLGPDSLLRKVFPIMKNYVLFFGGVALMHYQGQQLALPPPV